RAPTAAGRTRTTTASPRGSTRSSRWISTSPGARTAPRGFSTESFGCRTRSRTRTYRRGGVGTPPRSLRSSERVDPEEFSRRVAGKLGDAADSVDVRNGTTHVSVSSPSVVGAARTLKDDPELDCAYFTFLSAIDWEADGFEVLVALASLTYGNTVIMQVRLPADSPSTSKHTDGSGRSISA